MSLNLFGSVVYGWTLSILLIILGLLLCFRGRAFLKPLLGVLGAGVGAAVGLRIADALSSSLDPRLHYSLIVIIASSICAIAAVLVWKVALAQLFGFLGYAIATAALNSEYGARILEGQPDIIRYALVLVAVFLPMSLVSLSDYYVVPIISGAIGSALAIAGFDIYAQTGLLSLCLGSVTSFSIPHQHLTEPMLFLTSGFVFLACAGTIYQFLSQDSTPSNTNSYEDYPGLRKRRISLEEIDEEGMYS